MRQATALSLHRLDPAGRLAASAARPIGRPFRAAVTGLLVPLLLLLAVSAGAAPAAAAAPRTAASLLPSPVAGALASSGLPTASFGLYAQEVEGDRVVVRLNEEQPYTMASTTKLVTSLAALDLLGP